MRVDGEPDVCFGGGAVHALCEPAVRSVAEADGTREAVPQADATQNLEEAEQGKEDGDVQEQ